MTRAKSEAAQSARIESAGIRSYILAIAITAGMTIDEVADLKLCYAPPFAPVWDRAFQVADNTRFALA